MCNKSKTTPKTHTGVCAISHICTSVCVLASVCDLSHICECFCILIVVLDFWVEYVARFINLLVGQYGIFCIFSCIIERKRVYLMVDQDIRFMVEFAFFF